MTDDISKVVRFRCPKCGAAEHSRERRPNGSSKCTAGHSYPSRDAIDSSANRIESATTPAAVDAPGIDTANHAGVRVRGYTVEQYATLARQLAEANSELAMHRADAARVAACPWRVQKGHTSECQPPKRLQDALDQLAEATRRMGEVEGLVGKWRQRSKIEASAAPEFDDPDEMAWHEGKAAQLDESADELEAALTKEPTK